MNREIVVLLRLLNGRRFAAEMAGSAASVRAFTAEVETAATATSGLAAASATARGTLFAIGAASRVAGYGMLALGGAVAGMGISFDATMESNTLAFQKFTGSVGSAKLLLNQLFEIAASTPFTFADITTASRRLMAFGFNAQETIKWMKILGDTISYTGGTADDVFRAVKAVGEIRGIGRLQQRQLLQLTNLGINAGPLMAKGLGITEKKLHEQGRKGLISADRALAALGTQLAARYGGGAEIYSKTFIGQINKVKDYVQRASGTLVKPLFDRLEKDVFPKINKWLSGEGFKKAIPQIRNAFSTLGQVIAAPFVIGYNAAKDLYNALKPLKPFLDNVLKPFLDGLAHGVGFTVVVAFKTLLKIINIFAKALGWLGKQLGFTSDGFKILGTIVGVLFAGRILKVLGMLRGFGGALTAIGFLARTLLIPINLLKGAFIGLGEASVIASASNSGLLGGLGALPGKLMGVLKYAGPVGAFLYGTGLFNPEEAGSAREKAFESGVSARRFKGVNSKGKLIPRHTYGIHSDFAKSEASFLKNPNTEESMVSSDFYDTYSSGRTKLTPATAKLFEDIIKSRGWKVVIPSSGIASGSSADKSATASAHNDSHSKFDSIHIRVVAPIHIDKRKVGEAVGDYVAERQARK